ncbi:MAG TPA: flagellar basal body FlgE domain-containing protein [Polyangiales bacterium]|nr:flagellar basal body FlgE domain-containing protein [Polyangiales bacterium]
MTTRMWLLAMLAVGGCPRTLEVGAERDGGREARCPGDGGTLDLATLRALGVELPPRLLAKPTARVVITANLDVRALMPVRAFDVQAPAQSSSASTSFVAYDSLSVAHPVTLYFVKTDDASWDWHATVRGAETVAGGELVESASGTLEFNTDGALSIEYTNTSVFMFLDAAPQELAFDFGTSITEGGNGLDRTTGFAQPFEASALQDGYPTGDATGVRADASGNLIASYGNGQTRTIGRCR